jgi:hypothetical protein
VQVQYYLRTRFQDELEKRKEPDRVRLLNELPTKLRDQVMQRAYGRTLQRNPFFRKVDVYINAQMCSVATSVVYVRGETVQTFRRTLFNMDLEGTSIRFLLKGAVLAPDLEVTAAAPDYRTFDEDAFFSSVGHMRLPKPLFFAIEFTEVVSLEKNDALDVIERFPHLVGRFVRRHYMKRWTVFTKFMLIATLLGDAAKTFEKIETQRQRISQLRPPDKSDLIAHPRRMSLDAGWKPDL